MKIREFNDAKTLVELLSRNGIGQLKEWKNPFEMGWGSLTDYYQFGSASEENGMANNIAYYLEGNQSSVYNLKLILNVNNSKERKQALSFFSDIANRTFKSLFLPVPSGLKEAILNANEFEEKSDSYSTSFMLERSKIDTWELLIVSDY